MWDILCGFVLKYISFGLTIFFVCVSRVGPVGTHNGHITSQNF